MKYGLISDIHSNISGLTRAIDILKPKTDKIICLGDLIEEETDNINKIVDILEKNNIQTVAGNHDPEQYPQKIEENGLLFIHADPLFVFGLTNEPGYIHNSTQAQALLRYLPADRTFYGHTHEAKVFGSNGLEVSFDEKSVSFPLKKNVKYLLNPGAIHLARDVPGLGSCAVYDPKKETFEVIRFNKN